MFVIAGATGNTGSIVASTLLAEGKAVRALVRNPEKASRLRAAGAELTVADLGDTPALTRALTGATAAYLLLPPTPTSNDVVADQARTAASIAAAVKASGVPHVVLLSSIGAHLASGNGPIQTLHHAEKLLRETGAAVTAVRANYFMENWGGALGAVAQGILPTFFREGLAVGSIATRDIGATAAGALVEGGRGFQIIDLHGPQDLTGAEVATIVSTLVGKPINPVYAPLDAVVPTFTGFGLSENYARLFVEMYAGFNSGRVTVEAGAGRLVRGKTPIADVLRPMLASASPAH